MAKFRSSHHQGRHSASGSGFVRSLLLVFVAGGILAMLFLLIKKDYFGTRTHSPLNLDYKVPVSGTDPASRYFLPSGGKGSTIHHLFYSLSYVERYELAEWVAYELTRESLKVPNVDRTNWYERDSLVSTGSAEYTDYRGSGYTRGHLVPAGDMAFSKIAMEESFLMSNISPQRRAFNNGIWKELEELVRDWAWSAGRLYVCAGPVMSSLEEKKIGENGVGIPGSFYKVLLDLDEPEIKGIAFIMPNTLSERPVMDFAVAIDSAEKMTGIDFFPDLLSDSMETRIESTLDTSLWPVSEKRYLLRLREWNQHE